MQGSIFADRGGALKQARQLLASDPAAAAAQARGLRKPINREGIDQWKPYEQWLGPLKQALGDTLDHWRD